MSLAGGGSRRSKKSRKAAHGAARRVSAALAEANALLASGSRCSLVLAAWNKADYAAATAPTKKLARQLRPKVTAARKNIDASCSVRFNRRGM
jgi:hypothetical protein